MKTENTFISRILGRKPRALKPSDVDVYLEYKVIEPQWEDEGDGELVQDWFEGGEKVRDDGDWIYWIDLYKDKPERADLISHWFRCLFDPSLPRPRELKAT